MPTLSMPAALTLENRDTIRLNGLVRARPGGEGIFNYEWTYLGNTTTIALDFNTREITLPDETAPELLDYFTSVLSDWESPPNWQTPARQILDLAQSAVGVHITDLSEAQKKVLLVLILWDKGAIGLDLTIQPLHDWVRRRPDGA